MDATKLLVFFVVLLAALLIVEGAKNPDKQKGGGKKKKEKKPEPDFQKIATRDGEIKLQILKYTGTPEPQPMELKIDVNQRKSVENNVKAALRNLIPDETVRDFDSDVVLIAKALGELLPTFERRTPSVVSVNGSDSAIPHRVFNKYKVKGEVVSQHSYEPNFSPVKPTSVVTKWVHNHLLLNSTESVISEEVTRKSSTSTSMTSSVGGSVTASMSVNFWVASASASVSVGGSFSTTTTTEQEDVKTFMLQDTITVSPNSSAKVVWSIMERSMKLAWDAQLKIKGYFALQTPNKNLYFVPVKVIPYFIPRYSLTNKEDIIVTTISGIMRSEQGAESTVTTKEFPLQVEDRHIDKCHDGMPLDKALKKSKQS